MPDGSDARSGFVQRVLQARHSYRGPFCGADVCKLVNDEGFALANDGEDEAFHLYVKPGCKPSQ